MGPQRVRHDYWITFTYLIHVRKQMFRGQMTNSRLPTQKMLDLVLVCLTLMSILFITIPRSLNGAINHFITGAVYRLVSEDQRTPWNYLQNVLCMSITIRRCSIAFVRLSEWTMTLLSNGKNSVISVDLLDLFRIILQRYSVASFL